MIEVGRRSASLLGTLSSTWRWSIRRAIGALGLLALSPSLARAAEVVPKGADASHGRFDGDVAVAMAGGVTLGPRAPRASGDLRVRYLSTAGIFSSYEDGALTGSRSAEPRRVLALGVELRPLFLARWAAGRELGIPHVDLLIDSFGLELGAFFAQPEGGRFGGSAGLQLGLGFEVPVVARASGPFLALHGGCRWSDTALSGGPLAGPADRSLYVLVAIGWQQLFGGHVVDLGDPRRPALR